jgi:two-component system LytT family sensor kinase
MRKLLGLIALAILMIILSNAIYAFSYQAVPKSVESATPTYWHTIFYLAYWTVIVVILPWIGLLPLILHVLHLYPLRAGGLGRFVLLHFSICFFFSFAQIFVHIFFEPDPGWYHFDVLYRLILGVMDYFGNNIFFYVCAVTAYYAFTYFRQLQQKEISEARLAESFAKAQLNSLKMKLQPHFLFNALQSINVLVLNKQIDAASEMIEKLSILLRLSIDSTENQLETVERELEMLDYYLGIEEIRYKQRLTVEKAVDPSARKALIPSLILQPLIENSLKHGISKRIKPGRVHIDIGRRENTLRVAVTNDGPDLPRDWNIKEHSGVGLQTTIKRLKLLYGDEYSLDMSNAPGGGVVTEISIPYSEEVLRAGGGGGQS